MANRKTVSGVVLAGLLLVGAGCTNMTAEQQGAMSGGLMGAAAGRAQPDTPGLCQTRAGLAGSSAAIPRIAPIQPRAGLRAPVRTDWQHRVHP